MDWNIKLPDVEIEEGLVKCSFCNSSQVSEDSVFTGPEVAICHDCVRLLAAQIDTSRDDSDLEQDGKPGNPRTCSFCQREQDFAGAIFAGNEKKLYVCFDCVTGFARSLGEEVS